MPEHLEEAVIKHEKAHHEQVENPEFYWTTKLMFAGIAGLIIGVGFQIDFLTVASTAVVASMVFVENLYVLEKDANEGIDWDSVEESLDLNDRGRVAKYFEYFLYTILVLPGNIEYLLRVVIRTLRNTVDLPHRTTEGDT